MNTQASSIIVISTPGRNGFALIRRWSLGLGLGLMCLGAFSHLLKAGDPPPDLAVQISGTPVFYQQFLWVGTTPPAPAENVALLTVLTNMTAGGVGPYLAALEDFLTTYPDSAWLPSIEANLAQYYREHGLYTKALQYWGNAWQATGSATEGSAKRVGDFAFAYWTKLLASLGRVDTLGTLFQQTQGRIFDGGPLQQVVNSTKEGYHMMVSNPGACFKCGTYALYNVARVLQPSVSGNGQVQSLPSPPTGFNMSTLLDLAQQAGLNLVAAQWGTNPTVVVPSVVHWKENHYAAILKEQNGMYWVVDPTFDQPRWLKAADIITEASSNFLVPAEKLPAGWGVLSAAEAAAIYGKGYDQGITDSNDGCGNGSGGSGGNAGTSGTSSCCGMTVWDVSEPYMSVWLYDEPLGYQPGLAGRISFTLAYKQRESRLISTNFFSLGMMWDSSWVTYITDYNPGSQAYMYVAGGGLRYYEIWNNTRDFLSDTFLQRTTNSMGNLTGFIVLYANGAKDYYQYVPTVLLNAYQVAFLTAKVDPFGHTNAFTYQQTTNNLVTLQYVVDADGRTNTVNYTNTTFPSQITGVQDAFGRSTALNYNSSGMLTNVVDVAGLSSSYVYDYQGWVTNLVTPYGTTTFLNYTNGVDLPGQNEFWGSNTYVFIRAVKVIDPAGGTNIYILRQDSSNVLTTVGTTVTTNLYLPYAYPTAVVPATVPTTLLDNTYMNYRDSFHWGPLQAAGLPSDITNLSTNQYNLARMRHWLHDSSGGDISQVLDMQQDPSPDGVNPGQTTWYDYDGKLSYIEQGTNVQPSLLARVLPDGTIWYTWYQRDQWDRPTNVVDTYSLSYGGTQLTRTNIFIYSTNQVDLLQMIGPKGETLAGYSYNTNHQALTWTNATGDVTGYTYDAYGRPTSSTGPAGLVTTNLYYASGSYTNWVQTRIDLQINRTNSFSYTNDLVYLQTNELGLIITNIYDNLQRATNVIDARGTNLYVYQNLDLVQQVDPLGFTNSYGYDHERRLIAQTNALGHYFLNNYCNCGALTSVQDALGNLTYFHYDNTGWLTNAVYPDGTSVTNFYDLLGKLTNTIDGAARSVTNWFDNQGRQYAVSNALAQVLSLTLDIEDRATNTVDANAVSINQVFDNLGRVTSRTYPDTGVESFVFSTNGLAFYTNQLHEVTSFGYDASRRKTSETNANLEVTKYGYDAAGDVLTLSDGKSQVTTWNYNRYGLVSNKVDAASNIIMVYLYDADNRLTNRWTPVNTNTTYAFDAVGNVTNITYFNPHPVTNTYSYDAQKRLTNMIDTVGTTAYAYDQVGQLLSEDGPWANDMVSYTYSDRLRVSLILLQPNADPWNQTYSYDGARRLTGTISPAGTFSYTYDATRQLQIGKVALPNTAFITNTFDSVARVLSTTLENSGSTVLNSHTYTYNAGSQRTQQVRTKGDYVNYGYDPIGQLTNAAGLESGGVTNRWQEQLSYVYDKAHNLSYRTNNALIQTFSANSDNELTTIARNSTGALTVTGTSSSPTTNVTVNTTNAIIYADYTFAATNFTPANGANTYTAIAKDSLGRISTNSVTINLPSSATYTYDLNGNLLSDGTRGFTYDDENELIQVTVTNNWQSQFVYDGKLRRRIIKEFTWQNSAWVETNEIHFIYDANVVIEERDVNNLPQLIYTRGKDLSAGLQGAGGIGGLLALSQVATLNSAHYYYQADANGNITALVNSQQVIAAKYLYDPFGDTISLSGPIAIANTYRFSSKEYHQNSGLV